MNGSLSTVPFGEMWEDDRYWSRLAVDGRKFEGWFYYSGDFEKLVDHEIKMIASEIRARPFLLRQSPLLLRPRCSCDTPALTA